MTKQVEPERPIDIYNREMSEARDKYVKSLREMKLTKDERDAMYDEEDKGVISFKEELLSSPEIKTYMDKVQAAREKFMWDKLRDLLTIEDAVKFSQYEDLADYFAGGDVVKTLHTGLGHDDMKFGIMIYGKEYWMKEKDIEI
jgi:hypothetical protein